MTAFERRLMNEAPTVVGLMTSILESGGSIDTAVRTVAIDGPTLSSRMFDEISRTTDTKGSASIREALTQRLGELGEDAAGYRQAMMLCISASESSDGKERLRILREASDVSLEAVRIAGEKYSASLSTPCMCVFGLGIMAPMILMSILPMVSIGGTFGQMPVNSDLIVFTTLFLIPLAILAMSFKIRFDNPFISEPWRIGDLSSTLPLLAAIPLYIMMTVLGRSPEESITLSVVPTSAISALLLLSHRHAESIRIRMENGLKETVFDIGNSLLGGENFEKVSVDSISSRPECAEAGTSLSRELDLCRGDVCSAVRNSIGSISAEVSRTLCDIHRCTMRDTDDAGRMAIAVGRQFQNETNVRKGLEIKLKSMTDMMTGTAMIFAPMVLGMSVALLGPLSSISGYQGMQGTEAVLSLYILEICALISVLTSSLGKGEGIKGMIWRFSVMVPIALIVFNICASIALRR